jgi:hypothetical protein
LQAVALGVAPLRREIGLLAQHSGLRLCGSCGHRPSAAAPSPVASLGLTRRQTRGAGPGGSWANEPPDRRAAVHQRQDCRRPCPKDPGQARRGRPRRGRRPRHHEVRTTIATTAHRTLRPNPLLAGGESGARTRNRPPSTTQRLPILWTWRTADYGYEAGDGPPRRISTTAESSCRPSPARRPARYSCSAADASGAG